jgi:hypothetical protein
MEVLGVVLCYCILGRSAASNGEAHYAANDKALRAAMIEHLVLLPLLRVRYLGYSMYELLAI